MALPRTDVLSSRLKGRAPHRQVALLSPPPLSFLFIVNRMIDAVFVVDTLGELMQFYGCADVAFVGGSLQPVGGHNLLEPAAVGTAMVTGPHLHNFSDIAHQLDAAGALRICADAQAVGDALEALLGDAGLRDKVALTLAEQGKPTPSSY